MRHRQSRCSARARRSQPRGCPHSQALAGCPCCCGAGHLGPVGPGQQVDDSAVALPHAQGARDSCYRQDTGDNASRGLPCHPCLCTLGNSSLETAASLPLLLFSCSPCSAPNGCRALSPFPLGGCRAQWLRGKVLLPHQLSLCDVG